jgi:hypothetical protein
MTLFSALELQKKTETARNHFIPYSGSRFVMYVVMFRSGRILKWGDIQHSNYIPDPRRVLFLSCVLCFIGHVNCNLFQGFVCSITNGFAFALLTFFLLSGVASLT